MPVSQNPPPQLAPPETRYFERFRYEPSANPTRLEWDLRRRAARGAQDHESRIRRVLSNYQFTETPVWLEVGAGTGAFANALAELHPEWKGIALERCRKRGTRLEMKAARSRHGNWAGLRGNAISVLEREVPAGALSRIYILYPSPWPKNGHRKNRWYLHPVMPKIVETLKPGGEMIWASDQNFYIQEAHWVMENTFGFETLSMGPLQPNEWNELSHFPKGRSKFEASFMGAGLPCFELVCRKPHP